MSETSTPNPVNNSSSFPDFNLSPTQATSQSLPARPDQNNNTMPLQATDETSQSYTPSMSLGQPKFRGGFEVDEDDEDEGYNEVEEEDDDADVYDPAVSFNVEENVAGSGDEEQIDRSSQSPEQDNGYTPAPVQAAETLADSSLALPDFSSELRTNSVTPAQIATANQNFLLLPDSKPPFTSLVPKSRLAHDVIGILEDRIKDDPRGDTAAWLQLIEELKNRNKFDDVRQTYTRYFETFPMAAEQWCAYVRWEEANDQRNKMEQIFNTSLLKVPDVEFWSIYVNYIRRRNSMQTGNVANAYKIINSAFSFCLDKVGIDKDSGTLWQDYIDFLKAGPGIIGGASWEDKQKVDTLREAYQKALCVPTSALLALWKEYDAFETGLSKINGRKYLQERSPAYMTARSAYTQLQSLTRELDRTSRPRLPPAPGYEGDVDYAKQVTLWKQWVEWEKEDNLVLKEEDIDQYHKRILFTYRQALMALQFWPEMWYDAADFCHAIGLKDESLTFLRDGFKSNIESPLLAFRLADRIESTTSNDEGSDPGAKMRMKQVREPYDQVLDALYAIEKKTDARMQADVQQVEAAATANGDANGDDDLNASNVTARKAATDARVSAVRASAQIHLDMLSKIITHVWIALMRATRRVQGKGLPTEKGAGFRTIFNEARKRGKLTSDFYVESAQIEWQCYRDPTGTKILERGVKLFSEDSYIPLEYIKHLISKDDPTNARAVFETTVSRFIGSAKPGSTAKTKPLFAFFHDYESKYGELSQIEKIESRMQELFPEDPQLKQFSTRYSTVSFDPISINPIVSATQLQPKSYIQPSIEVSNSINSPIQQAIDSIVTNSPKRPLEDAEESQPRKLMRGESPLKGAAGRRMNQQQQQRLSTNNVPTFAMPPPFPPQIMYLLSILPKSTYYVDTRFDASKIVELIRDIHLPPPGSVGSARPAQPPQQTPTPGWPPHYPAPQNPPAIPQGYLPPAASQPPYGTTPFRYA